MSILDVHHTIFSSSLSTSVVSAARAYCVIWSWWAAKEMEGKALTK